MLLRVKLLKSRYSPVFLAALFFLLSSLLLSDSCFSQITTVSGTVIDPNNFPYAGASLKAQLTLAGAAVTGQPTVTISNQAQCISAGAGNAPCQIPFLGTVGPITLDPTGSFTMNLQDNTQVTPAGTQWLFSVTIAPGENLPIGFGPRSFTLPLTISGASQSVSVALSAAAPFLTRLASAVGIGVGGGSVTSVSSGNLPPLFTTTVSTPTTTPSLAYTLTNAAGNTVFGNCTGVSAPPNFCAITAAMLPGSGPGSGTVTSVGLGLPPQYSVSGSPVTTAGTLNGSWMPVPAGYFLGGPQANSLGGIFDGTIGTAGNSTTPSASLTPTTSHDLAITIFEAQGQAGLPTMPGGWTSTFTNGSNAAIFRQVFSSSAAVTAPVTLTTSSTWAQILFLLRLPAGNPTIVQSNSNSGAFGVVTNISFTSNTTTGNSILAVTCGIPASGNAQFTKVTDAQSQIYTQVGSSQNGANEYCSASMTASILGATTPQITFTSNNGLGSGFTNSFVYIAELSNLATPTGEPIFQLIAASSLPTGGPPVNTFSATTLGSDLAVAATTITAVMTRTITMPSNGCPCRAFISYSLYPNTATSGVGYNFWVSDGTNTFAQVSTGQSNASSGALTSASYGGYSTGTYANNAAITFTLNAFGDHTFTVKSQSPVSGTLANGPVLSSFQVAIVSSN